MSARDDLLLVGGTVVDPGAGLFGPLDIAVSGSRIAAIGAGLPREPGVRVIDVGGRLVTPGLIDMHVHVLTGTTSMAVEADVAGVLSGVTTVVDAGTAGAATFSAFPEHIIPASRTRIVPFMHIARTGLATSPDIASVNDIDAELTARALAQHAGLVAGIKVRMVSPALEVFGLDMLRTAKRLARDAGLPVMVHVGDIPKRADPELGRETLALLDAGDIVTHVFTANPGGMISPDGVVFPEVFEAVERGVLFDAAHGRANLSFDIVRRILDQGVPLTSISTDLTRLGRTDVVFSLTEVMSRYLEFGFSVAEVIGMTTSRPAAAVGIADRAGRLEGGRPADISVLELRDGSWLASDAVGETMTMSRLFVPVLTVLGGEPIMPEWGPHPSGWEPEAAS